MRCKITLAAIILLHAIFSVGIRANEAETASKPWIPFGQQVVTNVATGLAVVNQVPASHAAAIPLTHFASSQPAYALNQLKGGFGEQMMDSHFTSKFLKTSGGWSQTTPARIGRTGIDGLYLKVDKNGLPHDMLVSDAKYGSSRLGMTSSGPQMSDSWIKERLSQTSRMYRRTLMEIRQNGAIQSGGIAKNAATNRMSIPLDDKTSVDIWRAGNRLRYFCPDKTVAAADIEGQLNRLATYTEGVASGKVGYRSRLFSYKPDGSRHVFTISELDAGAKVMASQRIEGTFDQLPKDLQRTIKSSAQRSLLAVGKSRVEIRQLVERICNNPEQFNQLCMRPTHSWRAGLDASSFKMAGAVAVFAVGLDAVVQTYVEKTPLDWKRLVTVGAVTSSSAIVGNYVGTQVSLLVSQSGGVLGQMAGPVVGGGVASVLISYGLYAAGYSDLKTANRAAAIGVVSSGVGAATSVGAFAAVAAFGTASTGTAISSLSGAAATNATLAWFGGGSIAAGGGGVAGGAVVLSGGVTLVAIGAAAVVTYGFHLMDERDRNRYLAATINLTEQRVKEGKQIEWLSRGVVWQ